MQHGDQEPIIHLPACLFDTLQMYVQRYLPIVPEDIPLGQLTRVLDVGCGYHQWGKALFRTMVEQMGTELVTAVRIEGIDTPDVARQANAQIRRGRGQVFVSSSDMFHLPADWTESYDLVHARLLSPYVSPATWPLLLAEHARVCKPGGWVLWIEPALPTSDERTPAWNQWMHWMEQAITNLGGSPRISGSMEALFQYVGCWQHVKRAVISLPLTTVSPLSGFLPAEHYKMVHGWLTAMQPVLVAGGVVSAPSCEVARQKVMHELNRRMVASQWEWKTLLGKKL